MILELGGSSAAQAQSSAPASSATVPTVRQDRASAQMEALRDAERSHLWRVAAWGGANVVGGLALVLGTQRQTRRTPWAFGAQSAAWGTVNVGIAAAGLLAGGGAEAASWQEAVAAERRFHDILLLNMGLNVAYSSIGTAMTIASYQGVSSPRAWRGHGSALILQGLGLFVLDGIALLASRSRLADIIGVAGNVTALATPTGVTLALRF
jgi:hypothetical protein